MCVCAHTVCQKCRIRQVETSQIWGILALFSIHVCLDEMYVYLIYHLSFLLSYLASHEKWCTQGHSHMVRTYFAKHIFDTRVSLTYPPAYPQKSATFFTQSGASC